jgi:ribosomal subunit interface protein
MNVEVRGRNLRLNRSLKEYCERRLQFALGRFEEKLGRVVVRLSDVNGPRGGVDKRCQVDVLVRGRRPLRVESTDVSLHSAVDEAAQRVAQAVLRVLGRERDHALSAA